ncbi:MAG: DNA-3-methyladenine glycosylase [Candidatus Methanofastidiosia archaeon]
MKLKKSFYQEKAVNVAKNILGCKLVSEIGGKNKRTAGIIVETEAYTGEDDPGSHAYTGKTTRNSIMYGEPGRAYVYLIYGMYYLFNVVTCAPEVPGAVLIRALEPAEGVDTMKKRRNTDKIDNVTTGPGKLTQALGIASDHNGLDITGDTLWIEEYTTPGHIGVSSRIGVADEQLLRFFIKGNKFVSK